MLVTGWSQSQDITTAHLEVGKPWLGPAPPVLRVAQLSAVQLVMDKQISVAQFDSLPPKSGEIALISDLGIGMCVHNNRHAPLVYTRNTRKCNS